MTPPKNNEYVAKYRKKAREEIGDEAYKKKEAETRALRRQKAKAKAAEKDLKPEQDLKTKLNTITYVDDMLNTLFPKVVNAIPEKRKPGRPCKLRNPVGHPPVLKIEKINYNNFDVYLPFTYSILYFSIVVAETVIYPICLIVNLLNSVSNMSKGLLNVLLL